MTTKKTSNMGHVLLWFGAAVSIAEILTGALLAPLGFSKAMLAIILGHLIGCALLYAAGLIGAKTGLPAMESGRIAFGTHGSFFFSILNVLQLVGWTAVMIIGGAKAAAVVAGRFSSLGSTYLWCAVIGILIIIWILVGIKN
ncbi:MAG: cytosine permease, partial [Clostridia bacterium]